jgi:hypothetical protein
VELRDLIVTPIVLILVYVVAYLVRPHVTDNVNRKYFFPALTVRIIGALAVGLLYQFYYGGGDTFNFHTHGSRHIWEAFVESPELGMKLIFSNGTYSGDTFRYASKIFFYQDPSSFFVIRIAALFDILTFSTYSATAVLFSIVSFIGSWLLFLAFYQLRSDLHKWYAFACLFIPSVVFWGSGVLKDTLTFSAVGFMTFAVSQIFFQRKFSVVNFVMIAISIFVLYEVKKYILICYLPAVLLWVYSGQLYAIRSLVLKILLFPIIVALLAVSGYYSVDSIGKEDARYALDNIAETARITAYDIGFYTGRNAGSGYDLGELDGSISGMIRLAPQAINVSLFRPYLWEVRNPLMVLSAVESLGLLLLTFYVLINGRWTIFKNLTKPTIIFCVVFSLSFAFAVGVSTFNFGTLARYKIPLLPFYLIGMVEVLYYVKSSRKLSELDSIE